jgi:hypothetical protein
MDTEHFANGHVSYQNECKKSCINSLKDDVRYRFDCRCGCPGGFSGLGKDIKASGNLGQPTSTRSAPSVLTINDSCSNVVLSSIAATNGSKSAKERPFVSDRYLKKAVFGLNDDEIDEDSKSHEDGLAVKGMNLADRRPPGIGELVYSLATNRGPYSLLDYGNMTVKLPDGESRSIFCGIVRTAKGDHIKIPLADLANHWGDRPVEKTPSRWPRLLGMIASSIIGSAIVVALSLG